MLDGRVGRTFERFLELQVAVVLGVLWSLGAVREGICILALFLKGHCPERPLVCVRTLVGA